MKKKKLKIISLFLSVIMVIAFFMQPQTARAIDLQQMQSQNAGDDYNISMWIVSYKAGGSLSSSSFHVGHSYLIFYNSGSQTITIGHMEVPAGTGITIGLFGNRKGIHQGIWYNIEAVVQPGDGISIGCLVKDSKISTLNASINSQDYYDALTHNCAGFARTVWNSVAPDDYQLTGNFPETLYDSINSKFLPSDTFWIPQKDASQVAYQTETGVCYDANGVNMLGGEIY